MPDLPSYTEFIEQHLRTCMELDHEDYDYECAIDMVRPEDPVETPCAHVFCRNCLESWLDEKDTCPMCRQKLFSRDAPNWPGSLERFDFSLLPFEVDHEHVLTIFHREAPQLRANNPIHLVRSLTRPSWPEEETLLEVHDDMLVLDNLVAFGLFFRNEDAPARYAGNSLHREMIQRNTLHAMTAIGNSLRENRGRYMRVTDLKRELFGSTQRSESLFWRDSEFLVFSQLGQLDRLDQLVAVVLDLHLEFWAVRPGSSSPEQVSRIV